jgi:hypothetical protein
MKNDSPLLSAVNKISLSNYAGIPGTGPVDAVCSGCTFLEADGSRFLCAKYRTMTGRKGQHIRSDTPACRYFQQRRTFAERTTP